MKYCFLYLSIFPKDYLIQRMRLIHLWIAEGFIKAKEWKTKKDVADDYLKELLNKNLIQVTDITSDGRVKTLRIHNLLRDIIILKSKDQNFISLVKEQSIVWHFLLLLFFAVNLILFFVSWYCFILYEWLVLSQLMDRLSNYATSSTEGSLMNLL